MEKIDIKVKIESDGQKRIPLNSFLSVSEHIVSLINEAADAIGLDVNIEDWSVGNLRNSSVQYSVLGSVEEGMGCKYKDILDETISIVKTRKMVSGKIPENLYNVCLKIGDSIPIGGKVKLNVYQLNGEKRRRARWHVLNQENISNAREKLNKAYNILHTDEISYYGEIKGLIYSWQKEGRKPQIEVQDTETGERIKCYYDDEMYNDVYSILENKKNRVYVAGVITMNKKVNKITSIKAMKLSVDQARGYYKEGDLDKFFGCASGITDGLSAREYIDKVRDEGK